MRYQGKITTWNDDQGYGFITANGGDKSICIHVKSFTGNNKRPPENALVSYRLHTAKKVDCMQKKRCM
jgi:cold shock CspA family protein